MAVKSVNLTLDGNITQLKYMGNDVYYAEINVPNVIGHYNVAIQAEDEAGNISRIDGESNSALTLTVSNWTEPKIDWKPTDRFNFIDYNRIKNNLIHLHERAVALSRFFTIENAGEDISSYKTYWDVDSFNIFERNLEEINKQFLNYDYGQKQTFYENGVFIQFNELNRIENAMLDMKRWMSEREKTINTLPIRMGSFKGVRI